MGTQTPRRRSEPEEYVLSEVIDNKQICERKEKLVLRFDLQLRIQALLDNDQPLTLHHVVIIKSKTKDPPSLEGSLLEKGEGHKANELERVRGELALESNRLRREVFSVRFP